MARGKTEGRKDDMDPVAVTNRLKYFNSESKVLLDYYRKHKRLITVNGNQSIEDQFQETLDKLDKWRSTQTK